MKLNTNSNVYTVCYAAVMVIIVAFLLAFVASALKDTQEANVANDTKGQILSALGYDKATIDVAKVYGEKVQDNLVEAGDLKPYEGKFNTTYGSLIKNGEAVKTEEFSIYSIVRARLAAGMEEVDDTLNRALVQYGRYAQIHFNHKPDDMPDPDPLAPQLTAIPSSYAAKGDPTDFGKYISKFEAKIEMAENVRMNVYLTPAGGYGLNDFEIAVTKDGAAYKNFTAPRMRSGKIYLQISGFASFEMDSDVRIIVKLKSTGASAAWTRSLMTCAYERCQDATVVDTNKDLMKALYQYFLAARNKFLPT